LRPVTPDKAAEEGAASDLVEHFGALAFEPRAFACGHDGDGEAVRESNAEKTDSARAVQVLIGAGRAGAEEPSLRFSDKDRIVVPSVKVSTQAIMLQMAAAKEFGDANYARLDPWTIGLSHPDGLLAITNNSGGVIQGQGFDGEWHQAEREIHRGLVGNEGDVAESQRMTEAFVVAEEEHLILFNWAAQRAAKLISPERRNSRICRLGLAVKEVPRVQGAVP